MRIIHGPVVHELDDAWWEEAGMVGYLAQASAYAHELPLTPGREVVLVPTAEVEPLRRQLSHGVFNNSQDEGTARERVVRLLRGFRTGDLIPPIELDRLDHPANSRYRLYHGAHRFYCSVAAGFSHVPAVVYEPAEWMRSR